MCHRIDEHLWLSSNVQGSGWQHILCPGAGGFLYHVLPPAGFQDPSASSSPSGCASPHPHPRGAPESAEPCPGHGVTQQVGDGAPDSAPLTEAPQEGAAGLRTVFFFLSAFPSFLPFSPPCYWEFNPGPYTCWAGTVFHL